MSQGVIHQIQVSAGGVPKTPVPSVRIERAGLVGDAHAKRIHGGAHQAVSLYSLERIEALSAEGHPIEPGSVGENLTLAGLDWNTLEPGSELELGSEVRLRIESYAAPCRTIAHCFSDGRFKRISQQAHPGESRLYASVLRPGTIQTGDPVRVFERSQNLEREVGAGAEPSVSEQGSDSARRPADLGNSSALRLAYVNVFVSDLERSMQFFGDVLGLSLQFGSPEFGYASFSLGPVRMGIAQVDVRDEEQRANVGRMTGVGLAVADLPSAHAELEGRGVHFSMKPSRQPWGGFMALFEDPDGNTFYLDELPE